MRLLLFWAWLLCWTADALVECEHPARPGMSPALRETCELLKENYDKFDVIWGPRHFDNHVTYFIIALYRMGASAERIRDAYDHEVRGLNPAIPSQHMVNESSWSQHLRQGLYYKDYMEFMLSEVEAHGLDATMERYAPTALQGLTGSLLHPVIQLGYGYELEDAGAICQGLAWLLAHGSSFPKLNPKPTYSYNDAEGILKAMRADTRLPNASVTLEELQTRYADALSDYDIQLPEGDSQGLVPRFFEELAIRVFGTLSNNFFLLHLCTGSRAVSLTMPHVKDAQVRSAALQQLWKGFVYVYALEGRPAVESPPDGPLRPWPDLVEAVLPINDAHLQKMVYLCRENYKLHGERVWWAVAESVVTLFERGGDWVYHPNSLTTDDALVWHGKAPGAKQMYVLA